MKGYKAYNPGMICEGTNNGVEYYKQYEENTVYEEDGGDICSSGMMHFCANPFDVLDYYPLVNDGGEFSDFSTVEALDEVVTDDKIKFATKKIRIGAKLGFKGFVEACVGFLYEKTIKEMPSDKVSSGNSAQIGSSGNYAQIGSSGDSAQIGSSGNSAKINVSGEDSVCAAIGIESRIKASLGNWITLAEWKYDQDKGRHVPFCVKSAQIDGETLKPDTWYMLKGGKFVEVDNQ